MANGGVQQIMNLGFPKQKLNQNRNESENLSDFGFATDCRNPTTLGFRLEVCRIPRVELVY